MGRVITSNYAKPAQPPEPIPAPTADAESFNETAILLGAEMSIGMFCQRCAAHPRFEEDPVCVMSTERDKLIRELEQKRNGIAR